MPTCFVIMGFGEKTDLATGRKLDLDKTYKNIIRPAITAAGYECIRADEVLHSGVIDVPMYDLLYSADLVVADLSTANLNAVFELGVRHALKPRATIVIAEQEFRNPFDIDHILVRPYRHLGSDIGFDETMRVRQELQALAEKLAASDTVDSPVYTVLRDLEQPKRRVGHALAASRPEEANENQTLAALLEIAFKAKDDCDFELAKRIFRQVYDQQIEPGPDRKARQAWPCVIRELALATFEAGDKAAVSGDPEIGAAACAEAVSLLGPLGPETTTDPETLRLWSLFHGYRAQLPTRTDSEKQADLEIAIEASERAFAIKQDCRNGSNLAYLLNSRASLMSGDDQIADRVRADRVRRKVVALASARLSTLEREGDAPSTGAPSSRAFEEEKYWTRASLAESLIALGDGSGAAILQDAVADAPVRWMGDVAVRRIGELQALLGAVRGQSTMTLDRIDPKS